MFEDDMKFCFRALTLVHNDLLETVANQPGSSLGINLPPYTHLATNRILSGDAACRVNGEIAYFFTITGRRVETPTPGRHVLPNTR